VRVTNKGVASLHRVPQRVLAGGAGGELP
jgi:hypothetical protein